jgi:hypothetical protein
LAVGERPMPCGESRKVDGPVMAAGLTAMNGKTNPIAESLRYGDPCHQSINLGITEK